MFFEDQSNKTDLLLQTRFPFVLHLILLFCELYNDCKAKFISLKERRYIFNIYLSEINLAIQIDSKLTKYVGKLKFLQEISFLDYSFYKVSFNNHLELSFTLN